ncbi:alpha-glucan family phosphorylase [Stomatohabitans albus]|uniref:alpha-glucan family phosphorylase n=1 Tax=Stomatohabitans albus TaxID=3110766 RepID=UPI00300C4500
MAKAIRTFRIKPSLPQELEQLNALAANLRWSWHRPTLDLFASIDPDLWEETGENPVKFINRLHPDRMESLRHDEAFLARVTREHDELQHYLTRDMWAQFQETPPTGIAYFSAEFGLTEVMQIYSGGLGILAGDHLKSASDLGLPLSGVGLFYRHGYFNQSLDSTHWQRESYPDVNPHDMPVERLSEHGEPVYVTVDLDGRTVTIQTWVASVGRVPLLLLDTDVEGNHPDDRVVTDRLYGGDATHRVRQEIVLGIGGIRALAEAVRLGVVPFTPTVFHANEGHAMFLQFERMRQLITGQRSVLVPGGTDGVTNGMTFEEAKEVARAGVLFTTHTPVPAGIDRFDRGLIEHWFANFADSFGGMDALLSLGHENGSDKFNMAMFGLRLSSKANGVSKLHGQVSREMFQSVWAGVEVSDVPITSITNGVHAETWTSNEMSQIFDEHLAEGWRWNPDAWANAGNISDERLWEARVHNRYKLVEKAREWTRDQHIARGASEPTLHWINEALDPNALTIGFARRFATYKRATLLLSQPERLRKLLTDPHRPVQFIFAGKAHPADDGGKSLIRQIVDFTKDDPEMRKRLLFIENYDMEVARYMLHGVDVWLNNPRRPHEASGTSGEKCVLNGGLHASVLDGWWDEMYISSEDSDFETQSSNGVENGFAIGTRFMHADDAQQDASDAASLFDLLEHRIIPLFWDRETNLYPRRWMKRVRHSLATNGPKVLATRMVMDYTNELYTPLGEHAKRLAEHAGQRAIEFNRWKDKVRKAWHEVTINAVHIADSAATAGEQREIVIEANLGSLNPTDVKVQVLHGAVTVDGTITEPDVLDLAIGDDGRWHGNLHLTNAGEHGVTARIIPHHEDLGHFASVGKITVLS